MAEMQNVQIEDWQRNGGYYCCGDYECWIEPDGVCENGFESWLIELGLI